MSNVNVYFGAQPSQSQIVAPSVKARGLDLLKIECSKVIFYGHPTTVQPGYAVYRSFLPMFIAQAGGKVITDFSDPFYKFKVLPEERHLPIPFPSLVVSWNIPIAEEVKEGLRTKGWNDTVVRGKVAMIKQRPGPQDVRDALETRAISTTPAPENTVNIVAFRKCYIVRSMLTSFLAAHQYPAFIDKEHEGEFNKNYQEILNEHEPAEGEDWSLMPNSKGSESSQVMGMDTDADDAMGEKPILKRAFKVTLQHDFNTIPVYNDEHSMPKGEGLLFPYVPELAKFDRTTVVDVIRRYFYAGLGDEEEQCQEEFEEIVAAWGNIQNSDFGNIMAHIFKIVDISLTLQCVPQVMMTVGQYDGIFMRGSGFRVTILGKSYEPASRGLIDSQLGLMDHHANTFWKILGFIPLEQEEKETFFRTVKSIKGLKEIIDSRGVGGAENIAKVKEAAKGLRFPEDKEWDPTAYNICMALSFISEPTKAISLLPYIHYTELFTSDRLSLVWSAFGAIAPSFRVPGGKEMMLTKSFRVTNPQIKKEKGPQGHRDVTKIGAILVPLEVAIAHMKTTFEEKTVLNPHGNARVDNSASHANKIFEKDSCSSIVAALRSAARVTVTDEAGSKKRRTDDDETGGPSKKGRLELDF